MEGVVGTDTLDTRVFLWYTDKDKKGGDVCVPENGVWYRIAKIIQEDIEITKYMNESMIVTIEPPSVEQTRPRARRRHSSCPSQIMRAATVVPIASKRQRIVNASHNFACATQQAAHAVSLVDSTAAVAYARRAAPTVLELLHFRN